MAWTKLGDIEPLYNHVTLVAGDAQVMADWPGAEAAGYPDDEYALPTGSVMVFDLNLMRPTVFTDGMSLQLLASPNGKGTTGVDDAVLETALAIPGSAEVWGELEVKHGAMVLTCSDCATPPEGADGGDAKLPRIPRQLPAAPERRGQTMLVFPCANGRYLVSAPSTVPAKQAVFDFLVRLTIRRA